MRSSAPLQVYLRSDQRPLLEHRLYYTAPPVAFSVHVLCSFPARNRAGEENEKRPETDPALTQGAGHNHGVLDYSTSTCPCIGQPADADLSAGPQRETYGKSRPAARRDDRTLLCRPQLMHASSCTRRSPVAQGGSPRGQLQMAQRTRHRHAPSRSLRRLLCCCRLHATAGFSATKVPGARGKSTG